MTDRQRYHLVLTALPSAVPVAVSLRRLLKSMLRSFGFKCESLEASPTEELITSCAHASDKETTKQ